MKQTKPNRLNYVHQPLTKPEQQNYAKTNIKSPFNSVHGIMSSEISCLAARAADNPHTATGNPCSNGSLEHFRPKRPTPKNLDTLNHLGLGDDWGLVFRV